MANLSLSSRTECLSDTQLRDRLSIIASNATIARTEAQRLKGFLGRTEIDANEALWFENTSILHTFGMRTYIDVAFIDGNHTIVRIVHEAKPWRIFASLRARHAIELAPGTAARVGLVLGDLLALEGKNLRRW